MHIILKHECEPSKSNIDVMCVEHFLKSSNALTMVQLEMVLSPKYNATLLVYALNLERLEIVIHIGEEKNTITLNS